MSQGTSLFATCDNFMKVFLDGVLAFQDDNYGSDTLQWKITTELDIPGGTKVLGIECLDIHVAKGILIPTEILHLLSILGKMEQVPGVSGFYNRKSWLILNCKAIGLIYLLLQNGSGQDPPDGLLARRY